MLVYRQTGSDNQFTFVRGIVRNGFLVTPSAKFIEEALVLTLGEHKELIYTIFSAFLHKYAPTVDQNKLIHVWYTKWMEMA